MPAIFSKFQPADMCIVFVGGLTLKKATIGMLRDAIQTVAGVQPKTCNLATAPGTGYVDVKSPLATLVVLDAFSTPPHERSPQQQLIAREVAAMRTRAKSCVAANKHGKKRGPEPSLPPCVAAGWKLVAAALWDGDLDTARTALVQCLQVVLLQDNAGMSAEKAHGVACKILCYVTHPASFVAAGFRSARLPAASLEIVGMQAALQLLLYPGLALPWAAAVFTESDARVLLVQLQVALRPTAPRETLQWMRGAQAALDILRDFSLDDLASCSANEKAKRKATWEALALRTRAALWAAATCYTGQPLLDVLHVALSTKAEGAP
jgi:hypothetical protein